MASERKTGNEYERRHFREDLAAVRAHHDRRRSRTKGISLTLRRRKREGREETRRAPIRSSLVAADLMGFGSRYNFSFSPSGSSHFPQFRRVIYHLDNGSDFYLLNSTSRFLALPSISLTSHVAVPRFSYVCRVSNDAYRMDWKAMVGSIIDRSRHEEFKQPGCAGGDRERWAKMGMGNGRGWRGDRWRGKRSGRTLLEASIGRDQPSCWELLAAVPPGDKPLPATELP